MNTKPTNGTNGNGRRLKKRKTGRPSRFVPRVKKAIIRAVELGSPYRLAVQSAGVGYTTFKRWMAQAEQDEEGGAFRTFRDDVKKAEGKAVEKWLEIIDKAANNGSWQAAAWKLERRYPERFGRRTIDVRADIREEKTITQRQEIILKVLSDDKTRELASLLASHLSSGAPRDAGLASGHNGGGG